MDLTLPTKYLQFLDCCIQRGLFYGEIKAIRKYGIEATDGRNTIFVSYKDLEEQFHTTESGTLVDEWKPRVQVGT